MKLRLALLSASIVCAFVLVAPNGAAAATYHVYKQGTATSKYAAGAYFNKTHRKMVTLNIGGTCDDGSVASVSSTNFRVSSSGRFSGEVSFSIYHKTSQTSYASTAKFSGKVTKRKRVKVANAVTTEAPGCTTLSHSYTLKYKGTQSGG